MALYEDKVEKILETDPITKRLFLGAFARDELPTSLMFPCCFILNTDARHKSGGHWLAFDFDSTGFCSFFDSYGRQPAFYRLQTYIQRESNHWTWNNKRIQGLSEYCGYYCVLFLLFKARGNEKEFFLQFKSNYDYNDNLIRKLIDEFS
jgi:hypothetical protein